MSEDVPVLLVTRPCPHVAGVSLRTAVLVVFTAHGLDQWAAAPLSCGQFAAGGSRSTAALVVTFHISHRAGLTVGTEFSEPGYDMRAPGAGPLVWFTGVTVGAAVDSVTAADGRGQRAAAPLLGPVHEAAGCVLGAAGIRVAHFPGKRSWK